MNGVTGDTATWVYSGSFVIQALLYLTLWGMRGRFASKDKLAELKERLIEAEAQITALPTTTVVHELEKSVTELGGDVKELSAKFAGMKDISKIMAAQVSRMEEFLRTVKQ